MAARHATLTRFLALFLAVLVPSTLAAEGVTLPAGTYVYGELDERVTSKKKETTVGDVVRARVWRDVIVEGRVLIKAGTPLMTRVSFVKPAKVAGRKGEVLLDAISTQTVEGSEVLLDGGYDKSGKGKKALAWGLFLLAWPLVFIKGKQAILDPGTVFDASVQANVAVGSVAAAPFRIQLGEKEAELTAEILYDEMDPDAKQKVLPLKLRVCGTSLESAKVVAVNEKAIPDIAITLGERTQLDECEEVQATLDLKELAKTFTKGINRFEIDGGEARTEVILEIEL